MAKEKYFPKVGDACYIRQFTGNYYADMVKRPYTVIAVSPREITLQACRLIYPIFHYDPATMSDYYKEMDGKRICFYDTIAESIEPDPEGRIEVMTWHSHKGLWGTKGMKAADYPEYAIFGHGYQHQPYLN